MRTVRLTIYARCQQCFLPTDHSYEQSDESHAVSCWVSSASKTNHNLHFHITIAVPNACNAAWLSEHAGRPPIAADADCNLATPDTLYRLCIILQKRDVLDILHEQ